MSRYGTTAYHANHATRTRGLRHMSAMGHKRTLKCLLRCPLYPQKRTWIGRGVMSALCQKQTSAPPHSITSSAIASSDGGTVRLSIVAV